MTNEQLRERLLAEMRDAINTPVGPEGLIRYLIDDVIALREALAHYELTHFDQRGEKLPLQHNFAQDALRASDERWKA